MAGTTVSVKLARPTGVAALGPDSSGVMPHLIYYPDIAPMGTTGMREFDPFTGQVGREVSERPFAATDGMIRGQDIFFLVDIGAPFYCPWDGRVWIEGGTVAGGGTALYMLEVIYTTPQECGAAYADAWVTAMGPVTRQLFHGVGAKPSTAATYTFINVPDTATNTIPRGASKIQVPTSTSLVFSVFGTAIGTIRIDPGAPVPLGGLSQGTFTAAPGTTAQIVAFHVEIA